MNKKYFFGSLILLFLAASAFMIIKKTGKIERQQAGSYSLLPRKASLTYTREWETVKNNAAILESNLKRNPADIKSLLALTALYIQEGRVTGNLTYYNMAAMDLVGKAIEQDPKNFEALTFKATILLSQHRFEEAYKIAEQARQLYPHNAYVYGLIVDASVELGKYDVALAAADKMISIRPDIRSYSRIAYLREIHGDLPGAMEAMQMAVEAGSPGDENTEWCRIQLGKLFEQTGKIKEAEMQYTIAERNREQYPYALAGLAGIASHNKNHTIALSLYIQADSLIADHIFKEGIAEQYQLMGEPEKARTIADEILVHMKKLNGESKEGVGQNEDHEMAHAYMGVEDPDNALKFALAEYQRRPANIEVNETVAIVYYRKGEYAKALPYIETALKTNCKNPELLCHAGLIYNKTGNAAKAKKFLGLGMMNNPVLPAELKLNVVGVMKTLL